MKKSKEDDVGGQAFKAPRKQVFMFLPEEVVIVGLDEPFKDAPEDHELYDNRKDMELSDQYLDDLEMNGVLQTIQVTKSGDLALVVDGRQRVRGLRKINERLKKKGVADEDLLRVPAMFVQYTGAADLLGRLISSNAHHHQDSIIEKAEKSARLINLGKSQREVAIRNGVSQPTISSWMKLLTCVTEVKRAVDQGRISASAASELSDLHPDEQRKVLGEMLASNENTAADAKKKSAKTKGSSAPKKPGKKIVRKIIEDYQTLIQDRPVDALRWAIGDLDPDDEWEELSHAILGSE